MSAAGARIQSQLHAAVLMAAAMALPPFTYERDEALAFDVLDEMIPHLRPEAAEFSDLCFAVSRYRRDLADETVPERVRAYAARQRFHVVLQHVLRRRLGALLEDLRKSGVLETGRGSADALVVSPRPAIFADGASA